VLRQKWSRGPGGSAACQPAAVSDRHGGLCRRPSSSVCLTFFGWGPELSV
jgi:hypothetical protein